MESYPALRQDPRTADGLDSQRIDLVRKRWHGQDAAYLGYARTVEEHIRMLSGRHWDVWSELSGRFVDALRWMSPDERRWRQRPVMDYLGYWFLLTLSKVTENPPVISFMPATADHRDASLAETMEPIWKTLFDDMDADERIITMAGWLLAAGMGYFVTRVDFQGGAPRKLIAPALLSLAQPDGQPPIERVAGAVPYDQQGNPLAQLVPDPERPGEFGYEATGEPYQDQAGMPALDVASPLEIRAQWGSQIPWSKKRWIIQRWFLSPDDVERRWQVKVAADHSPDDDEGGPGYLERLLFGTGYFGAARGDVGSGSGDAQSMSRQEGFVGGYTMWERPDPSVTPESEDDPGGRLLVCTGTTVLWDSKRPFRTEAAGPIRRCVFMDIPGRPHGSTPLEKMVPLQKRLNRIEAQIAEHTNLVTNPILLLSDTAGIDDDDFVARPGTHITHNYVGPGRPAEWLAPPSLSADVWRHKEDVRAQLFVIGSMAGGEGSAPTDNASGELVQQLRFNSDRPLAPLSRSLTLGIAGVAEDVLAILPTIWTDEQIIDYAGEDNVMRTLTVLPEMFEGRVNVKPIVESANAESREQRLQRVMMLYNLGAWGQPGTPEANGMLLKLARFPDLTRATRPGGIDRVTAEHNVGRLMRGDPAQAIPVLEVYDLVVHLGVVETFMKTPEYLALDPAIIAQCDLYRQVLIAAQMQKLAGPAAQMQAATAIAAAGPMAAPPSTNPSAPSSPDTRSPPVTNAAPVSGPPSSSAPRSTRAA